MTLSAISRRLATSSFLRRPPMRPSARAAARPAEVRSRIMARSNSAKAPTICIIIRPAGVVGVDRLGNRAEARAGVPDSLHDMQHVLERARQAVELPDDDDVTLPQLIEHALQLGPVPASAGGGFFKNAAAP